MIRMPKTLLALACLGLAAQAGAAGACSAHHEPAAGEPTLEQVRRATERFRDVNVALAEGYLRDPHFRLA